MAGRKVGQEGIIGPVWPREPTAIQMNDSVIQKYSDDYMAVF